MLYLVFNFCFYNYFVFFLYYNMKKGNIIYFFFCVNNLSLWFILWSIFLFFLCFIVFLIVLFILFLLIFLSVYVVVLCSIGFGLFFIILIKFGIVDVFLKCVNVKIVFFCSGFFFFYDFDIILYFFLKLWLLIVKSGVNNGLISLGFGFILGWLWKFIFLFFG